MRILVVDDELELVQTVIERLEIRGIPAIGVTSGPQAIAALQDSTFDVVLVDVKMPGMGGLELLNEIQRRWPQLAVVLLTGHGSSQLAEEGLRLGASAYLMKPIELGALLEILRDAVQHHSEDADG
jgi:DNA-binding NtrC family response regulator